MFCSLEAGECEDTMGKYEYLRRKISANRRNRQKMNVLLKGFLAAAVVLVLVLSVMKIYAVVQNGREKSDSNSGQAGDVPTTVSAAAVAVEPQAVPEQQPAVTPRPKAVALTFDDGPSRANTGNILQVLQAHGAHATFFVLGDRARVDGDILQMELAAGCEIASHSWNHPMLSKMKWRKVRSQIRKTDSIVKKLANGYQITLLRPPYGAISKKMRKKLDRPMVLWSLDTLDWKTRNARKIFKKVKKDVKDGDIILMHDIHAETAEAIKKVVPWLQKQGYDVLTVSELMARKGKTMEAGKAYCDGR